MQFFQLWDACSSFLYVNCEDDILKKYENKLLERTKVMMIMNNRCLGSTIVFINNLF